MTILQLIMILWFFVFPILGITLSILIPVVWFFIVPRIARKLTYERFSNVSYHMVADDTGYVTLESTKEQLPEGVVRTQHSWRFLPRPHSKIGNPDEEDKRLESIMLRKFTWRDTGKPMWYGYAGKVGAMNPATLALLQQTDDDAPASNTEKILADLKAYAEKLPKELVTQQRFGKGVSFPHLRKDILGMLKKLKDETKKLPYTVIDPTRIKELIPLFWTPSVVEAVAINREERGKKMAGKQYGGLILGGALIIGLVIIAILAILILPKML